MDKLCTLWWCGNVATHVIATEAPTPDKSNTNHHIYLCDSHYHEMEEAFLDKLKANVEYEESL